MKEFETTGPGVELETLTELENLARLPRPQFELKREDAAPRLDLPIERLDDEVANLRSQLVASTNGGQALALTQPHNSRAAEASRAVSYGGVPLTLRPRVRGKITLPSAVPRSTTMSVGGDRPR